jgi:hypothetical protein
LLLGQMIHYIPVDNNEIKHNVLCGIVKLWGLLNGQEDYTQHDDQWSFS